MSSSNAAPLFHRVLGPTQGPPIVLLHGFPLDHTQWLPQAEFLARGGWRVLVPDLRGHGQSALQSEAVTMKRLSDDVAALVDHLGLNQFVLGGFSLGGYVALQFFADHPDRVRALLLVDTRAEADSPEGRAKRNELVQKIESKNSMEPVVDAMLPAFFTEPTRRKRPDLVEATRRTMLRMRPEAAAVVLRAMAQRPDRRPLLPYIHVPTLVLVGADDPITPPAASRVMAQAIPNARLDVIPQAAHLTPLEQPEVVNAALESWLAELP